MHQYYTVAMVPPMAGLVGMSAADSWQHRDRLWVRAGKHRRYSRVRCNGIRRPSSCVRFIPDVATVGYSRRHRHRCSGMVSFAVGVRGRGSSVP